MAPLAGRLLLAASALGAPLTRYVVRRFGLPGALVAEAACAGLFARDAAMVAGGATGRLRRVPAALLWLETVIGAAAVVAGLPLLLDAAARRRAAEQHSGRPESARRWLVAALFALHTIRLRIYLQPGRGLPTPR